MRMRDRDRRNAAQRLNPRDGIAVHEAHAVPQNIPGAILNQESALANGELRFRPDAPDSWALRIEGVAMAGS